MTNTEKLISIIILFNLLSFLPLSDLLFSVTDLISTPTTDERLCLKYCRIFREVAPGTTLQLSCQRSLLSGKVTNNWIKKSFFSLFGRFNKRCIFGGKFSENDNQLLSFASRWLKKLLRIIHKMLTERNNFNIMSTNQIANQNIGLHPHHSAEPMSGKNSKEANCGKLIVGNKLWETY